MASQHDPSVLVLDSHDPRIPQLLLFGATRIGFDQDGSHLFDNTGNRAQQLLSIIDSTQPKSQKADSK